MENSDYNNYLFQLNNKNRSAAYFLLYIVSGALFLAAICIFIFTNKNIPLLATIVIAIIYFFLFHLYKPSYFEMLVSESELIINYYSVATALKSYQTIEIDISLFHGYEILTKNYGMTRQLLLTVKSKFGLADYPPVSISILSKNELNQVIIILAKLKGDKM
jgi:hypothetical protein